MLKLLELLKVKKVLVSDGALGTYLFKKGLQIGECPELWNLTNENEVFSIAKSYIDAGSDIIGTNSFGGNRLKLKRYGFEDKAFTINKTAAVQLRIT
ncbi:MAG: homocysteine S-methyltransferase family protein [Ignavibacteriaceae bacterium]|nr:homocysteine S-methyltransferase family protein [Ignavibacteriaceae bacterium]